MDRWAFEQALAMLRAKSDEGQLSPEAERRIRQRLGEGDAQGALAVLRGQEDGEARDVAN